MLNRYRANNHLYALHTHILYTNRAKLFVTENYHPNMFDAVQWKWKKKGTLQKPTELKQTNKRKQCAEAVAQQMGHISLKFMRFKLMRINQNGIRFNFYLNCLAVCCCFVLLLLTMKKLLAATVCFCIFNEFIFGVGSFVAPECLNKDGRNEQKWEREWD